MRRLSVLGALIVLAALGPSEARAQVNCFESGGSVICSDGRTFTRSGTSLIDPRGNIYQEYGQGSQRQIYGTTPQQGVPSTPPTGNILTRPGETCVQYGNQVYCTPVSR
jgi:hypothetical protein